MFIKWHACCVIYFTGSIKGVKFMDRSIFVALSGLSAGIERLNLTSNNLANINTSGFKKFRPLFAMVSPRGQGTRAFVSPEVPVMDSSYGAMTKSGRPLDLAIEGKGFFVVKTPRGTRYTRQGDFKIDTEGRLTTQSGYPVLGPGGPVKLSRSDVEIDRAGSITDGGADIGRIKVVRFNDSDKLIYEGGVYRAGAGAKPLAVKDVDTKVVQGFIEGSNVSPVKEMASMMENLRTYQTQIKLIQAIDGMTRKAIEEVGKV